jgi:fucokinase
LVLEQMMSTGGGWQDQVGGLVGGFKLAASPARLPLELGYERLEVPVALQALLEGHLVLVYTGTQRLARNLLQNVLRRYYARSERVLQTVRGLRDNAAQTAQLLTAQHKEPALALAVLGRCLDLYWQQKRVMAGGAAVCEPPHVSLLMEALRPHVHGMSLCGAGGGGFLVAITRQHCGRPEALQALHSLVGQSLKESLGELSKGHLLSRVRICGQGLRVAVRETLIPDVEGPS